MVATRIQGLELSSHGTSAGADRLIVSQGVLIGRFDVIPGGPGYQDRRLHMREAQSFPQNIASGSMKSTDRVAESGAQFQTGNSALDEVSRGSAADADVPRDGTLIRRQHHDG